jgi:hypothetical protein
MKEGIALLERSIPVANASGQEAPEIVTESIYQEYEFRSNTTGMINPSFICSFLSECSGAENIRKDGCCQYFIKILRVKFVSVFIGQTLCCA